MFTFSGFPKIINFLENVSFQHKSYCLATISLDISVCIINRLISIKKYYVN